MSVKPGPWSILLVWLLLPWPTLAQKLTFQGNYEGKWAEGKEYRYNEFVNKRTVEDRFNLDLYYRDFRLGTRITFLDSSEFGETRNGWDALDKRFLEYDNPNGYLHVRLGDFYTVWGRGLTLALIEDINQGFDSGLDGILVGSRWRGVEAEVIAGRSELGYLGSVSESAVYGAHVAAELPLSMTAGLQAVLVDSVVTISYRSSQTIGGYLSYDGPLLSLWAEHAREEVDGSDETHDATYLSASGFAGNIGIALDYKNYSYNFFSGPTIDSPYTVDSGLLPFHSPPIVQREFTSNLFGKHPHIVRFDDEVGAQLEVTWSPGLWGTLVLSMSQSSAHPGGDGWIPSLNEEDSPFREVFLEMNSYPGEGRSLVGWTGWSEELLYTRTGDTGTRNSWNRRGVLGAKFETPLTKTFTGLLSAEAISIEDLMLESTHGEGRFELGVIYLANYSLTATYEVSEVLDNQDASDRWFNIQGRAFFANRHEFIFLIGRERGGLVCSSGKCRTVTPFNGFKVTMTTLF